MKQVLLKHARRLAAMLLVALAWSAGAQAVERSKTVWSTVSGMEGDYTAPGLNTILTQEGNDWILPMYKGAYYDNGTLWFYTMTEGIDGFEDSHYSIDIRSKFQVTGKVETVMLGVGFNDSRAADDDLEITVYAGPVADATPHRTFTTTTHDIKSYYVTFDKEEVENATFNIRFTSKTGSEIQGVLLRSIYIKYSYEAEEGLGIYVLDEELTASTVNGTLGTGTYSFDPETRTMTISNATLAVEAQHRAIDDVRGDLTVKVVGQNNITGGSAIAAYGALTIVGEGQQPLLTVTNGIRPQLTADFGYKDITIDNVAITLNTDTAAVMCIDLHMKNGASLKMSTNPDYLEWAAYPFCKISTLTLDEGISILTEGVTWNADRRKFVKDGEEVTEVEIGPEQEIVLIDPELVFASTLVRIHYGETPVMPELINSSLVGPLAWSSSNEQVASVNDNGGLTVNGIGSTYITVTFAGNAQYSRVSATYELIVEKGQPEVHFVDAAESMTVVMGEAPNEWPVATINIEGAELTYASEDETVATVNAQTGVVTPVAPGTTRIYARFAGNDYYEAAEASYALTIEQATPDPVEPVLAFNKEEVTVTRGDAFYLVAPTLENPAQLPLTWSSSDETVATVNQNGYVTVGVPGETTISAAFAGNEQYLAKTASYRIIVTKPTPRLSFGNYGLVVPFMLRLTQEQLDGDFQYPLVDELPVKCIFMNLDNVSPVTWSSDTEGIFVDDNAVLHATTAGETIITASFAGDDDWAPASEQLRVVIELQEPVEPISEEVVETPADEAQPGAVTTSESGIVTSLGEADIVNTEEGSITMTSTMTTDEVKDLLETVAPGTTAFEAFKGFYFLLAGGKGYVDIDIETYGDYVMNVIKGSETLENYVQSTRGTVHIEYNEASDTWMFIYPAISSAAGARSRRAPAGGAVEGGLIIYQIKIVPEEGPTSVIDVNAVLTSDGAIYDLQGRKLSNSKTSSSQLKGIYIMDGKKVVVN